MKRLIIFYLSTLLLSNPLYGEERLTNKQLAKFNKFKLSIELLRNNSRYMPNDSTIPIGESKSWNAYLGSSSLKEPEFFKIAEHQFEYEQAVKYQKKSEQYFVSGLVMTIIGGALIAKGSSNTQFVSGLEQQLAEHRGHQHADEVFVDIERPNPNRGQITGGILTGIIGIGLIYSGGKLRQTRWANYSTAVKIVDDYNKELRLKISKDF